MADLEKKPGSHFLSKNNATRVDFFEQTGPLDLLFCSLTLHDILDLPLHGSLSRINFISVAFSVHLVFKEIQHSLINIKRL